MSRKDIKVRETTVKEKETKSKRSVVQYEVVNGVHMRKNRLDTVITVDVSSVIIGISGENPKNFKVGDLYE